MRKGAAGYGPCILSSAIRVTSTFADVAYSKASGSPGAFSLSLLITYHKQDEKASPNMSSFPQSTAISCVSAEK